MRRPTRKVAVGLAAAVALALGAWVAGEQIQSPAQIAAETAAPKASSITVPVERRVLSSEVIVRGTVRYGSPQPVVLATSAVKQAASSGEDIVTTRPRRGANVGEGTVVMTVSGRPVFVLRGAQPSHRDLAPGTRGPDVAQLERALARLGFSPGIIDGRYDGGTAAAVAAWYERNGRDPFGATDFQLEQLRAANAAAAVARDTYLQSRLAIKQAATEGITPGEIAQARIDLETARDAVDTAAGGLRTARIRLSQTRSLARRTTAIRLALANQRRDNQLAAADVALKQAAVNSANDALFAARTELAGLPPDSTAVDVANAQAAVRAASDAVAVAQADLTAAIESANAARAAGRDAVALARSDRRTALHDARTARAELVRARLALPTARRQASLAAQRLRVLESPGDTSVQRLLSESAAREATETAADAARLARRIGVIVPANEVLFFPTLPLRVDTVKVKRGDSITGQVMTVSNSRLAIDSSLSLTDARLVRRGAPVKIEEQELGVRAAGTVTQVADRPGTHKVEASRVYLEVTPGTAPGQLVGASVKLTIAVKSTGEAVLAVPVNALSVGADGSSRVQVQQPDGETNYVDVVPGLAAQGLVAVRPVDGGLTAGRLVVVGRRGSSSPSSAPPLKTGGPSP